MVYLENSWHSKQQTHTQANKLFHSTMNIFPFAKRTDKKEKIIEVLSQSFARASTKTKQLAQENMRAINNNNNQQLWHAHGQ